MPPLHYPQAKFVNDHQLLRRRLYAFLCTKRGRRLTTKQLKIWPTLNSALSLKAINLTARIRFTETLGRKLGLLLARQNINELFFVTVIVREHAVPLTKATAFDVTGCKNATYSLLHGLNFVGMVEAAYYYRSPFVIGPSQPFVAWHSHAIVWGGRQTELAKRKRAFNQTHRAFVPGACAAHYRRITRNEALSYARYMSKSLLKEYTAYPLMCETPDPETGELLKKPTSKWRNRKRTIRPTNLVRAMEAIGARSLKELSFANGSGKHLRREILKGTRRKLHSDGATREARNIKLLFGAGISKQVPLTHKA